MPQHLTPQIPMLAPFLDRMVTRDISLRFNATEALEFFEMILPGVPDNVMDLVYPEKSVASDYEWDRWQGLPVDFIKEWEGYREPPLHFSTSVLRWICSFRQMRLIVPPVRLFFFRLTLAPSQIRILFKRMRGLVFGRLLSRWADFSYALLCSTKFMRFRCKDWSLLRLIWLDGCVTFNEIVSAWKSSSYFISRKILCLELIDHHW
jgi:hypothetical protein